MKILNDNNLVKLANKYKSQYQAADPFPHVYLDNFFDNKFLDEVLSEFPDLSKKDSIKFKNNQEIKLAGKGEQFFGPKTKILMHFLNSQPILEFLQILTGIEEPLLGDPYYIGGGQHEIKRGGLLKIHADFNKHQKTKLDRRINLLVYLNKDWEESFGGHFELWNRDMTESKSKILPVFNRITIFTTTDFSYHGHPNELNCPENRSRKSLALYYYSNGRPESEVNKNLSDHSTLFKERKGNISDRKAQYINVIKEFIPPILTKTIKKIVG